MIKPLQTYDGIIDAFNQALAADGCEDCRVHLLEKLDDQEAKKSGRNWKVGGGGVPINCPPRCHTMFDRIDEELSRYDVIWS